VNQRLRTLEYEYCTSTVGPASQHQHDPCSPRRRLILKSRSLAFRQGLWMTSTYFISTVLSFFASPPSLTCLGSRLNRPAFETQFIVISTAFSFPKCFWNCFLLEPAPTLPIGTAKELHYPPRCRSRRFVVYLWAFDNLRLFCNAL